MMGDTRFQALVAEETRDHTFITSVQEKSIDTLPPGEVLIRVQYSSLNYKDALSATGNRGVTKKYPHTPGIDAAGVVHHCSNDMFTEGERVLVTGYDLGMNTPGGYGQYIRVPANWVVRLPPELSARDSMIYGTAGFTAGLSVHALIADVEPERGEILVTGASGGVGSIATAILAHLGYYVVAVSGKPEGLAFLKELGAQEVIDRAEVTDTSERPLLKSRWAGAIDTVGGEILSTAIRSTRSRGTITCCGNVASHDLPLTVYPFILRAVKLVGIGSQNCPMDVRTTIWQKLASDWNSHQLKTISEEVSLAQLPEKMELILRGGLKGRVIVNME